MITLKEWLYKNARFPILLTLALMFLSLFVYFFFWQAKESQRQLESAKQFIQLASLGIEQNNRTLLETALHNSFRNLNAKELVFCEENSVIVSYPTIVRSCEVHATPFAHHLIELSAIGMPQYRLFLYVPRFPEIYTILLAVILSGIFLFGGIFLFLRFYRKIKVDLLSPLIQNLSNKEPFKIRELENLRKNNQELIELRQSEAVSIALYEKSTQLAHDIRSPLSAFDAALDMMGDVSERQRVRLRQVSSRIHDLANSLLKESASTTALSGVNAKPIQLLAPIIEDLVSEKRIQHRHKSEIDIQLDLQSSYGIFADIAVSDLNRVLSNIIDNAVEALDGKGKVAVHVSAKDSSVTIKVTDSGKGIPEGKLPRIMMKGETFGKKDGKGFGLYFAKQIIERNDGKISIDSKLNVGTTVSIVLPTSQAPDWFVPQISIASGMTIVIIDDDPTIHEVWKMKFSKIQDSSHQIKLVHFLKPRDL